jgi:hypothetical protein
MTPTSPYRLARLLIAGAGFSLDRRTAHVMTVMVPHRG